MIRKGNKMLQISVPAEIVESMDKVSKAISSKIKRPYTKGMLVVDVYSQWLERTGNEIQASEEKEGGKSNA